MLIFFWQVFLFTFWHTFTPVVVSPRLWEKFAPLSAMLNASGFTVFVAGVEPSRTLLKEKKKSLYREKGGPALKTHRFEAIDHISQIFLGHWKKFLSTFQPIMCVLVSVWRWSESGESLRKAARVKWREQLRLRWGGWRRWRPLQSCPVTPCVGCNNTHSKKVTLQQKNFFPLLLKCTVIQISFC